MKNALTTLIVAVAMLTFSSCGESDNNLFIAGHVVEQDNSTTLSILGPDNVEFIVNKTDVVSSVEWDEKFEDLRGEPKLLELKKGAIVTHDSKKIDFSKKDSSGDAACDCEVSCGRGVCCATGGWKRRCSGRSCVMTTIRC